MTDYEKVEKAVANASISLQKESSKAFDQYIKSIENMENDSDQKNKHNEYIRAEAAWIAVSRISQELAKLHYE